MFQNLFIHLLLVLKYPSSEPLCKTFSLLKYFHSELITPHTLTEKEIICQYFMFFKISLDIISQEGFLCKGRIFTLENKKTSGGT